MSENERAILFLKLKSDRLRLSFVQGTENNKSLATKQLNRLEQNHPHAKSRVPIPDECWSRSKHHIRQTDPALVEQHSSPAFALPLYFGDCHPSLRLLFQRAFPGANPGVCQQYQPRFRRERRRKQQRCGRPGN